MGSYTETNVIEQVWTLLRDYGTDATQQLLTDTEIVRLLRTAERIYSNVRPRTIYEDVAGNGTSFIALPATWEDGFSTLVLVESPVDKVPEETIDPRYVKIGYSLTEVPRLVFDNAPGATETVRIGFTVRRFYHASTAASTTVLDSDHFAVCDLTASIAADSIAGKYARSSEPVIGSDVAGFRSRVQEWQSIAKRLRERWEAALGIGSDSSPTAPASAWANWDSRAGWGGLHLTHDRRVR